MAKTFSLHQVRNQQASAAAAAGQHQLSRTLAIPILVKRLSWKSPFQDTNVGEFNCPFIEEPMYPIFSPSNTSPNSDIVGSTVSKVSPVTVFRELRYLE